MEANLDIKAGVKNNQTFNLNTPKPHRGLSITWTINLPHSSASDDVNLIREPPFTFQHSKLLTVCLIDSPGDLFLVTTQGTTLFSLLVIHIKLTESSAESPSLIIPMCCLH